jgi:hypothetical protein
VNKEGKTDYAKRSQKDYSLSLNIQVVNSIERGELSTIVAVHKYVIQARSTVVN